MKVYVIKRNNETYFEKWVDHFVRFVDNVRYSEMFHNKVSAEEMMDFITRNKYKFNISKEELSIVEYSLMSETELTDYTKQVRKEVCEEIRKYIPKCSGMDMAIILDDTHTLNTILDQIQGETK